jgi:hypothetical protein
VTFLGPRSLVNHIIFMSDIDSFLVFLPTYLYFRRYIEETFNFLMTMVLLIDSFAILSGIAFKMPRIFKKDNSYQFYFLRPLGVIFNQGSAFMILSMAFERYFASRNPLSTHQVSF